MSVSDGPPTLGEDGSLWDGARERRSSPRQSAPVTIPAARLPRQERHYSVLALIVVAILGGLIGGSVVAFSTGAFNQDTAISYKVPAAGQKVSGAGLTPAQIYRLAAPGTVYVQANAPGGGVTGSGFILDGKGYILTNNHVITGAQQITVTFENQRQINATVVGTDPSSDLAVLKINTALLKLHSLPLGDSSTVGVGDPVVALGAPFGLAKTLTTGVISSVGRTITSPDGFPIVNVLQTDAPINPGNSGGPLLDGYGRVIGVTSQIESSSGSSSGVGFAIPVNTVKQLLPALMRGGVNRHSWLGIAGGSVSELPSQVKLSASQGAYVSAVVPGGPAAKAGIRGGTKTVKTTLGSFKTGGDVIVSVNGTTIVDFSQLVSLTSTEKPGTQIRVGLIRGQQHLTVSVTLGVQPAKAAGQVPTGP